MAGLLVNFFFWINPNITNIDRRTCHRVVPMEVLVLGLSRTATSSIRAALKQLGYNDTYHAGVVYTQNPRDAEMWVDAYQAKYHGRGKPFGKEEFDMLLGDCMAVTDVPCLHFKEELIAAYPTAKIILSMRDSPEAWLKSFHATLVPFAKRGGNFTLLQKFKRLFLPILPFREMSIEMVKTGKDPTLASTTVDDYINHNNDVRRLCAERDERAAREGIEGVTPGLLEFNVKQGWRPLCEYLGKPIPRDEKGEELPFPRLNDTESFNSTANVLGNIQDVFVLINLGLTVAGVWAAYKVVKMFL